VGSTKKPGQKPKNPLLSWNITVSLLTNRFILFDFMRWMLLTYSAMACIACLIGLFSWDIKILWGVFLLFGFVCAGMTVLFILIMLLLFRNRMELAFAIDKDGITALVASPTAKAGNRLAVLLGIVSGKSSVLGAGLLARDQECTRLAFGELRRVRFSPGPAVISLRDKWFRQVRLYCRPENYDEAKKLVENGLRQAKPQIKTIYDG